MNRHFEPGLLRVFRLFAIFQFIFLIITLTSFSAGDHPKHPFVVIGNMALLTALLIVYLSIPAIDRALGTIYLPLAIMTAVIIPIAGECIALFFGSVEDFEAIGEETIALLIMPLLVISWQYRFRVVVIFVISIALIEFFLLHIVSLQPGQPGLRIDHRDIVGRSIAFLAGGYIITWLMNEQRAQRRALARANAELSHHAAALEQLTISRERNRMARELHDTLAHTLSGIAVQLEAMRSLWDNEPVEARNLLDKTLGSARHGLAETRSALKALRATPLEDMGLVLALRDLGESTARRAGLVFEIHSPERMPEIPGEIEHGIYRIVQEGLENIVRHAQASKVLLDVSCEAGSIRVKIRDDGRGFDASSVTQDQFGLQGMRERIAMLNGAFQIESSDGKGTEISLDVPVRTQEEPQ